MLKNLDAKLFCMSVVAKEKVKEFLTKEDGDVNIVSIVVLIGIALILAVTFKEKIRNLLNNLFNSINNNANNVMND